MRSFRAVVLTAILAVAIVPSASAAARGGDGPGFDPERIVRVVKKFLRTVGIINNSDQLIGPRP